MQGERFAAFLVGVACLATGCYPSNVVAVRDRAVVVASSEATEWKQCAAADLTGYFESCAIDGDAALSLRKVYYLFVAGGRYSGAALVDGDVGPSFQTLGGTWSLDEAGLSLDGAPPVRCESAEGGRLRIALEGGSLTMRRIEGQ